MNKSARKFASLATTLLMAGCIAIPYADWKSVPLDQKHETEKDLIIVPGDRVRLHGLNGHVYILKVAETDERGFYGIAQDDKKYRLTYDNFDSMEVLRGDVAVIPLMGIPISGTFSGGMGVIKP